MTRIGVLDFDTSHVVEFTKRLNHIDSPEAQWVEGGKVVIGCPGESKLSPERIPGYAEQMKKYGVPLVDKPADMFGKIDAVIVAAVDGSVHLDRAKPFLEAGVPCFVDKPFACTTADARAMFDLAAKKKVPLFSSSSLRYAPDVVAYADDKARGKLDGVSVFGPASQHPRNPGLFHYGIHAVEILYTLMGPGCVRVTCQSQPGSDVATGQWKDGRLATVRGNRGKAASYGFTGFADGGAKSVAVGTGVIYRELLKRVVEMFKTGTPPIDPAVTLEIVAFIEAANRSAANHGAGETVKT